MNSLGHLSAGVRYVLIHFDVIGHCPKRMNLDLGSNIECIPMVNININLIEPVVKCSNVQRPLGTFLEYGIRLMKTPNPDFSFHSCYVTLIPRRTSLAHAPNTERRATTCRKFGAVNDMRRCCPGP